LMVRVEIHSALYYVLCLLFVIVVPHRGCSRTQMDRADLGTDRWPKLLKLPIPAQFN
jgi:hypothetical protein